MDWPEVGDEALTDWPAYRSAMGVEEVARSLERRGLLFSLSDSRSGSGLGLSSSQPSARR